MLYPNSYLSAATAIDIFLLVPSLDQEQFWTKEYMDNDYDNVSMVMVLDHDMS